MGWMGWILLRTLVQLEHLAVLKSKVMGKHSIRQPMLQDRGGVPSSK